MSVEIDELLIHEKTLPEEKPNPSPTHPRFAEPRKNANPGFIRDPQISQAYSMEHESREVNGACGANAVTMGAWAIVSDAGQVGYRLGRRCPKPAH